VKAYQGDIKVDSGRYRKFLVSEAKDYRKKVLRNIVKVRVVR